MSAKVKKYLFWGLVIIGGLVVLQVAYTAFLGAYAQGSAS